MTYFQAYLLTRLDPISALTAVIGAITLGILLFGFAAFAIIGSGDQDEAATLFKKTKKLAKVIALICSMSFLLCSLIPTTKEAAFIYIAPKIINNGDLQESIKKLPKLTNLGLEYLNDMLEKEKEK